MRLISAEPAALGSSAPIATIAGEEAHHEVTALRDVARDGIVEVGVPGPASSVRAGVVEGDVVELPYRADVAGLEVADLEAQTSPLGAPQATGTLGTGEHHGER